MLFQLLMPSSHLRNTVVSSTFQSQFSQVYTYLLQESSYQLNWELTFGWFGEFKSIIAPFFDTVPTALPVAGPLDLTFLPCCCVLFLCPIEVLLQIIQYKYIELFWVGTPDIEEPTFGLIIFLRLSDSYIKSLAVGIEL
jgi:hypothetical protein